MNSKNSSKTSVALPEIIHLGDIERTLFPDCKPYGRRDLVLSLEQTKYVDASAVLYLLALVWARKRRKLNTLLRLPKNENVLSFLQAWRFPEALQRATGIPFREFVFGESPFPLDLQRVKYWSTVRGDRGVESLLPKHFFEINSFDKQYRLFSDSLVQSEATRWAHITKILRHVLPGTGRSLASRIVYEALSNAVRHPGATQIHVCSRLSWTSPRPQTLGNRRGRFVVSFWDDGEGMTSTLRRALKIGRPIVNQRAATLSDVTANVLHYKGKSTKHHKRIILSGKKLQINAQSSDAKLFVATTFPGVTSDVEGLGRLKSEGLAPSGEGILQETGLGLYLLTNAAVGIYGGTVNIYSGKLRMKISSAGAPDELKVAIREFPRWPDFFGNLVTINVPVKEELGKEFRSE